MVNNILKKHSPNNVKPRLSKEITIGNVTIGGNNPIAIQSMTNTKTSNIKETIAQINELFSKGCDIVRVACLDIDDAKALKEITSSVSVPIVADIHFDYRIALEAIENGISKLRLNPGNITDKEQIKLIVDKCKEKNIPIRIGINSGSINKDIFAKYGNTAEALVESAFENIKILEELEFYNIVISLKSSSVSKTIEAYKLLADKCSYPLHLGITEAGLEYEGTVKSSIALGHLLLSGIGDTIRVSLTTDPVREVICGIEILSSLGMYPKPRLISCPTCGRCEYNMMPIANEINTYLNNFKGDFKVAVMGCVVNGPGEAKDADLGIAGGKDCAILFKHGKLVKKLYYNEIIKWLKMEIYLLANEFSYEIKDTISDDIKEIREIVFIKEQGFKNEFDEIDNFAKYATIYHNDLIIATGRIYQTENAYHIGRLCVRKEYRKKDLGSYILLLLESTVKGTIYISGQVQAKEFYQKNGYQLTGVSSDDEGVPHVELYKEIK